MLTLLSMVLLVVNATLAVPTVVYCVQVFAGLATRRQRPAIASTSRVAIAVVVPAHNEENGIVATVKSILRQLRKRDRLLVVADNCDDRTAELALAAGAEVIQRHNLDFRGKGYALDAGINHLSAAPPSVVIFIDADCVVEDAAIDQLTVMATATGRPIQALYLIKAPQNAPLRLQVAEFAFLVKNHLRPAGLHRLGLPCHLTGSGMAFPWRIIRGADLAHGHIVEDMKLGLDMAREGHPPEFCEAARITSLFPYSSKGAQSQRRRWEEGHLAMTLHAIKSVFTTSPLRGRAALALSIDLLVPPITLLLFMLAGSFVLTAAFQLLAPMPAALAVSTSNLVLFTTASILAWAFVGRLSLPPASLWQVPGYIFSKLGLYARALFVRKATGWIRTDREGSGDS